MSGHSKSWLAISTRAALLALAVACAAQLLRIPEWHEAYILPASLALSLAIAVAAASALSLLKLSFGG